MVIGTNAMYAYEAAAGVFFDISTMATRDMDILWDIRPKLILVADKDMDNTGFLGIIKKVDRSFESISPGGFRAVNRDGLMVEKQRDHDQGLAVAQLIIQYLPQYQFNASELRMFPKDVVQKAKEKISDIALPVGIDLKENKSPNQ